SLVHPPLGVAARHERGVPPPRLPAGPPRAGDGPPPPPPPAPPARASSPRDIPPPIRRFAEQSNNIVRWTEFDRGGHFAAMELPALLVGDIREFFRQLR